GDPPIDSKNGKRCKESAENTGDSERLLLCSARCRCRVCVHCGPKLGYRVRGKLLRGKEAWHVPYLLTLTIDRRRFASAEAAWEHVSLNRYVARLMGELGITRWMWVLEFQMKTAHENGYGWPHWHLVVDLAQKGGYVDLKKAWHLWRDLWGCGG